MSFIALLDANAMWSAAVRDTLLLAAERKLFRPAWTMQILEELAHSLKRERPDLEPARIDRTISRMYECFPEALIDGYQDLIPSMRNHEADRHMLAAAVAAKAEVIVTWNLKHFSADACHPLDIHVHTPDEFLCYLWQTSLEEMEAVLAQQAACLNNPPKTLAQLMKTLHRLVPTFAETANLDMVTRRLT